MSSQRECYGILAAYLVPDCTEGYITCTKVYSLLYAHE